jgi:NADPH:quinone reductase-like Zn-dependent oxidoreductase
MRAVVLDRYGPPEVLRVDDVARPEPQDDELLVRVHASTMTRGDAMRMRSVEYRFTRLFTGVRRPRRTSFGSEFAGVVEEAGPAVTELQPGDEVFGVEGGATAEHSFRRCRRSLKPGGTYVTVDLGFGYHVPLLALVTRFVGSRRAKLGIGSYRKEDLALLADLVDAGRLAL